MGVFKVIFVYKNRIKIKYIKHLHIHAEILAVNVTWT